MQSIREGTIQIIGKNKAKRKGWKYERVKAKQREANRRIQSFFVYELTSLHP
ncbi:MAG: hypothetical protein Phog2KO_35040 [Phototrophicaceae bacterium]